MFTPDYFTPVLDEAIPVKLAARSFVIPVAKGIGELMVYPFDVPGDERKKQGMPILDKAGNPKGTGIVFRNYTDGAVQTARDDGARIILINGVTKAEGAALAQAYEGIVTDYAAPSAEEIEEILSYAHDQLGIDDFFNSDLDKLPSFEVLRKTPGTENSGLFLRRSDEERFALLAVGSGSYAGPASSPQTFSSDVGVVRNAKHAWLVDTKALLATYRHPDDRELVITDLPAFDIAEGVAPVRSASFTLQDLGRDAAKPVPQPR